MNERQNSKEKSRPRSRLARALGSIRSEAARALQNEAAPRRISESGLGVSPLPPPLQQGLSPEERAGLCEVEDGAGRLLLCMQEQSALRQGLPLRLAVCAPFIARGQRLVLHKKRGDAAAQPGKWNILAGPVRPGEAGQEAALRLLATECGIDDAPLRLLAESPAGQNARGPLCLYGADLPAGLYPLMPAADLLEADADELAALARQAPELLGPELLWAALGGLLFR